jgi:hypothetical protein
VSPVKYEQGFSQKTKFSIVTALEPQILHSMILNAADHRQNTLKSVFMSTAKMSGNLSTIEMQMSLQSRCSDSTRRVYLMDRSAHKAFAMTSLYSATQDSHSNTRTLQTRHQTGY